MDEFEASDEFEITRVDPERGDMRVTRLYTEHQMREGLPALLRMAAEWIEETDEAVREGGPVDGIPQALQVTAISYQDDGVDGETLTIVWTT